MTGQKVLFVILSIVISSGLIILIPLIVIGNAEELIYNYDHRSNQYKIHHDIKKNYYYVNIQEKKCSTSEKINGMDDICNFQCNSINRQKISEVSYDPDNNIQLYNSNKCVGEINWNKNSEKPFGNIYGQKKTRLCEDCSGENSLTLMTWNIYQGADQSPIFGAKTSSEFINAVGSAYNRIQQTNFVERAASIANEVNKTLPDLIGLQEVILLRTYSPPYGDNIQSTNSSLDYLQILIHALTQRGLIYEPIIVQESTDIQVPGLTSTGTLDIRLTDRDVILAKKDRNFTLSNFTSARFAAELSLPTPFGLKNISRSWISVDVTFDNENKVRVVSTHLEALSSVIQELQAKELLNKLGNSDLPIIYIGDFNSNANGSGTPTYTKIKDAGVIDAWDIMGHGIGFTCCQSSDLLNLNSSLNERIDLVMFRGDFDIKNIKVVGNQQNGRTVSGQWPSDHAGVVADLTLNSGEYY
jgi:endonuclease/exonuclease/phosphatase family metal-dependent hydrolase